MCDIDEIKSPNILFLKGVYMRDCKDVNDIMGDRLAEMVAGNVTDESGYQTNQTYNKIPQSFTDINTWPTHTNLLCFECSCPFTWPAVFIPEAINPCGVHRGVYKPIKPIGNFCSFICANMHIDKIYSKQDRWEKRELLKLLHTIMSGGKVILDIDKGVKYTEMEQYGGTMTVADFQSKNKSISMQCGIIYPPEMFTPTVEDYE